LKLPELPPVAIALQLLPPEELDEELELELLLEEELELLDELEELELLLEELDELEELLLPVSPGHGDTVGVLQPQPVPVLHPVMLMVVLILFMFGPPSGDTESRFNCPV
jgi:hypothetical protein